MKTKLLFIKQLLLTVLLLCVTATFDSCNNDNDLEKNGVSFDQLRSAPYIKITFPQWLSEKIAEIEEQNIKGIASVKIRIYKGKWKNREVYYIYGNYQSCRFCEVYYDDGEKVVWSDEDISSDSFCSTSKNWKLIYEFGEGVGF